MQQEKIYNYPSSGFGRIWMRLPLILRSIILGFGVASIGIGAWLSLFSNFSVPWSVSIMGVFLVLYWMYFSGRWNPKSTKMYRKFCFRKTRLDKSVWPWALTAGFFIILSLHFGWELTFRINEFQPDVFKVASYLNDYPAWMAWAIIVMASLVAGICEEIGYRGYLQAPLEKKYGPVVGISITSAVFAVIHLHQAWAGGLSGMAGIFIISSMIGYLAYVTQSLIPGIIAHVSFDIINFSYWWSDVLGTFERKPIEITGIDNHFVLALTIVLLSFVLFFFTTQKLLKQKAQRKEKLLVN